MADLSWERRGGKSLFFPPYRRFSGRGTRGGKGAAACNAEVTDGSKSGSEGKESHLGAISNLIREELTCLRRRT